MPKGKATPSTCPSSATSRSPPPPPPPPVSLSYSNWPRKRVSLAAPKKNPIAVPIPQLQKQYSSVEVNQLSNDACENKPPLQENNKVAASSPTIQHHIIKGRISPVMVARKSFSAQQDIASQQLMGRKTTQPFSSSSCPSSPKLSPSSIPIHASSSAPPSTAISTRTARPSFARRTSAPSLLVSALVASHAHSREKLSQDLGGPKGDAETEKTSPPSSKIPVASPPTVSVTAAVENAQKVTTISASNDYIRQVKALPKRGDGPLLRPALKHSTTAPESSAVQRKSVHFESKFERIRLFLEAETPHAVTFSPTSLGPEPRKDAGSIVLPNFPPLTTCYHSKPVSVESVSLSPDGTHILGLVQVQNLAYEKVVRARYTFDCWNTAQEAVARYKEPIIPSDSNHRGLDRFEFSVPLPSRLDSDDDTADLWRTMYMAVQYQVDGTQYWDSNSGQNYQINIRQPPSQCFEDEEDDQAEQGIFHLSDLDIVDEDSKENSPDLSSSPRKFPSTGRSIRPLSAPCSSASDFGIFSPKPSPLSAKSSTGTIPLRTTKKKLANRYDFGASLAATVRPRSSPPSPWNSMYHRPTSPLSFSSFSSSNPHTSSPQLASTSLQIPTSSSTASTTSSPYPTSSSTIALSVTTPSQRPSTTNASIPFMSSSSVEAPISSTPWEERARTAAVAYCRPSSPSCDFSSNNPSTYDSSPFPGIPSAWTSYSPSLTTGSPFDVMYPGPVTSLSSSPSQPYHQPYSPLSSPYSSSPPATAIWG